MALGAVAAAHVVEPLAMRTIRASEPIAVLRGGERLPARLVAIDAEGRLELALPDGKRSLAANDIAAWGAPVEPRRGIVVLFRDGGSLPLESLSTIDGTGRVESAALGRFLIPVHDWAGIVLHLPPQLADRDALANRVALVDLDGPGGQPAPVRERDELWFENGDELTGEVVSIDEERVTFRAAAGEVRIELARLQAIALASPRRPVPAPRGAWVGFDDGSLLLAASVKTMESTVEASRGGQPVGSAALESLAFYQPLAPGATWLSDLEPAGYRHVPFLDIPWPFRADRNVAGGRLRARGRMHLKGLGMHSASRITYKLDKPYRRFAADLAIDDAAGDQGSVVFRVLADGKQAYKSEIVRGGEPPLAISVDIAGAKQLSLLVEFADRGDERDLANWLDARVEE